MHPLYIACALVALMGLAFVQTGLTGDNYPLAGCGTFLVTASFSFILLFEIFTRFIP